MEYSTAMAPMWKVFNDMQPLELHPAVKGVRFEGTATRSAAAKFEPMFEEGKQYAIRDFVVAHNTSKYRTTTHKYKATLVGKTDVRKDDDDDFPKFMYSFKTFEEIECIDDIAVVVPFDVIGRVVHKNEPKELACNNGTKKRVMDMILEDTKGERICCSLWEDYVEECNKQFLEKGQNINIIILQLRPSIYQGAIKVCNGYHYTKLLLNAEEPAVLEFREKYMNYMSRVVGIDPNLSTAIISSTSQGTSSNMIDDLSIGVGELKTIEELAFVAESGSFWICGTVVYVDGENGWFYISCKKCHKKLRKEKNEFYCKKCKKYDIAGNIKYKVTIHISDESGSSPFLLCDRECMQIIGKPAAELNMNEAEDMTSEIEQALMRKKFLLKINVLADHSVSKLTDDPNIISTYTTNLLTCSANLLDSQESNSISMSESCNVIVQKVVEETPTDAHLNLEVGAELMDDGSMRRSLIDEFSSTRPTKKTKVSSRKRKTSRLRGV